MYSRNLFRYHPQHKPSYAKRCLVVFLKMLLAFTLTMLAITALLYGVGVYLTWSWSINSWPNPVRGAIFLMFFISLFIAAGIADCAYREDVE